MADGALGDVAARILNAAVSVLESTHLRAPSSTMIAVGQLADDCCDFVALELTRAGPCPEGRFPVALTGPDQVGPGCGSIAFVEFRLVVGRQVPTLKVADERELPSPTEITAAGLAMVADAEAIVEQWRPEAAAIAASVDRLIAFGTMRARTVTGGCGGLEWPFQLETP